MHPNAIQAARNAIQGPKLSPPTFFEPKLLPINQSHTSRIELPEAEGALVLPEFPVPVAVPKIRSN